MNTIGLSMLLSGASSQGQIVSPLVCNRAAPSSTPTYKSYKIAPSSTPTASVSMYSGFMSS